MAFFASLMASLGINVAGWNNGLAQAQVSVKSFHAQSQKNFGEVANSIKGMTSALKAGGAAMAVGFITRKLEDVTSELVKARNAGYSFGQTIEVIAGKIPLIGDAMQIGFNVRELILGEQQEIDKVNKLIDDNIKKNTHRAKVIGDMRTDATKLAEDVGAAIKKMSGEDIDPMEEKLRQAVETAKRAYDVAIDANDGTLADARRKNLAAVTTQYERYTAAVEKHKGELISLAEAEYEEARAAQWASDEKKKAMAISVAEARYEEKRAEDFLKEQEGLVGRTEAVSTRAMRRDAVALYTPQAKNEMVDIARQQLEELRAVRQNLESEPDEEIVFAGM